LRDDYQVVELIDEGLKVLGTKGHNLGIRFPERGASSQCALSTII
jgi:hypothetical protein